MLLVSDISLLSDVVVLKRNVMLYRMFLQSNRILASNYIRTKIMQCKKNFLHMLNDKQLLTLQMFGGQLLRFSVGMSLQYAMEYSNNLCSGRNIFHHGNLSNIWNSYIV